MRVQENINALLFLNHKIYQIIPKIAVHILMIFFL